MYLLSSISFRKAGILMIPAFLLCWVVMYATGCYDGIINEPLQIQSRVFFIKFWPPSFFSLKSFQERIFRSVR